MQERKSKLKNKFIRFTGVAMQMGVTIYLASELGNWLDVKYENKNELYFKICTLFGVFIAIYSVIRQVTKISKNND